MSHASDLEELNRLFTNYSGFMDDNKLVQEGHKLVLEYGSVTYGRAYRIFERPVDGTSLGRPLIGPDFLGLTAGEAYEALRQRISVVADVLLVQKRGR